MRTIILLIISYAFSLLANLADQYTTWTALKSPGFKEANLFRFSKNQTVEALVKCVALPIVGLVIGMFLSAFTGILYNAILGAGTAFVAFRNYRLIHSK